MRVRVRQIWYKATSGLWFIPMLMALGSMMASVGLISLDQVLAEDMIQGLGWVYSGGPEGTASLLSAIASSSVTVAGVVFSVTVVALTLASSQFGPRLLSNFMRDKGNQVVLGTFIATFLYSLLVLRTIRHDPPFVPHLSVTVAIGLALASFFLLIFFIHHLSSSIKADNIIALVEHDFKGIVDELYPTDIGLGPGEAEGEERQTQRYEQGGLVLPASGSGYVQAVDSDGVMDLARERDLVVRLDIRPGDFLVKGSPMARVWPSQGDPQELAQELADQLVLGRQRTPVQDLELCLNQLVEIAIRALSQGVNDTFTAIICVDRLGSALSTLAERHIPSPCRYDENGRLRVIASTTTFAGAVDAAFNLIRQNANIPVMIRLLETIGIVAGHAHNGDRLQPLLRQAEMIKWDAMRRDMAQGDLKDILKAFDDAVAMIRHIPTSQERKNGSLDGSPRAGV